jgi:WD40 repeat protein
MSGRIRRHFPVMNILCRLCASCQVINSSLVPAEIGPSESSMSHQRERSQLSLSLNFTDYSFSRHLVRTIAGHSEWVRCVVPSDDGKFLASGSKDHVRLLIYFLMAFIDET